MKKILLIILMILCLNTFALAQDQPQVEHAEYKKTLMTNWFKNHPEKASELNSILSNSQNPTADLQKWLDKNPEAAEELQQLVMPENE